MHFYIRSLRFAYAGLRHALATERNLRLFSCLYALSLVVAGILDVTLRDWEMAIFSGGIFLSVELINTALERFTDAFDAHSRSIHSSAIKATKDIAAGASLICALTWVAILCIIFLPNISALIFA